MSKIFITGSADGLGQMAARSLVAQGHDVVLHARNPRRAADAMCAVPGALAPVSGDLSSISSTIHVAEAANSFGPFDAIIHNAAVGYTEPQRINTPDNIPQLFAVNSLAPYILTCLIAPPKRLIYLSSGLHRSGDPSLEDLTWEDRKWIGFQAYADSKLHDVILAFAVARLWPGTLSNSLEPGWVATKMGGPGAPDSLEEGPKTQVWLAAGEDPKALVTGKYFYHQQPRAFHPAAVDPVVQDRFLAECARISGIVFPMH